MNTNIKRRWAFLFVSISLIGFFSAKPVLAEQEAVKKTAVEGDAPLEAKLVIDPQKTTADPAEAIALDRAVTTTVVKAPEAKSETSKLPESQIPVLTGAKEMKKAAGTDFHRIFITLGVFTLLCGVLIFTLKRWMGRKAPGGHGTKIKVLTTHALGPKKSLAIIQVAGEAILIGVTDQNISMLKTLALIDDEVPEDTPNRFDSALSDYEEEAENSRYQRRRTERQEPEEFAMRGLNEIRDTVSTRLKGMKNF